MALGKVTGSKFYITEIKLLISADRESEAADLLSAILSAPGIEGVVDWQYSAITPTPDGLGAAFQECKVPTPYEEGDLAHILFDGVGYQMPLPPDKDGA